MYIYKYIKIYITDVGIRE